MKQIQGKPINIGEDIVGRITFGKNVFQRSDEILVSKDASTSAFGYVATITTKKPLQIMESLVVWSMTLTIFTRVMLSLSISRER